jgi:hypothetical protein
MNKTKSPSRKSAKLVKAKKTKKGPVRYVIGSVGRMTRSVVRSVGRGARSLAAAAKSKSKTRKTSRRHKRKIVRSQAAMKATCSK